MVPYGYSDRHPYFHVRAGKNQSIAPGSPMWPAHPTGVNRGYRVETVVRKDGTLKQATATAGPVIYRGGQFGESYLGNAFVPEPAGNLIRRYILDDDPARIEVSAAFAYEGREFLTSTDERFRPVNMYNAPDGALYVVDMYRGFFQHARYVTDHLLEYVVENELYKPVGKFGRIYRIVRDDREIDYETPSFSGMRPSEAAAYLKHENGMLRDLAQQVLVQCSPSGAVAPLEKILKDRSAQAWSRMHALWTLEGLDRSVYSRDRLTVSAWNALDDPHPRVRASAIRILEPEIAQNDDGLIQKLEQMAENDPSTFVQLQLLASLGESAEDRALRLMAGIMNANEESPYFRELVITGVFQREQQLSEILKDQYGWRDDDGGSRESLLGSLQKAIDDRTEEFAGHLTGEHRRLFEIGQQRFQTCIACHDSDGSGMNGIGSALSGSEWVLGNPKVLVRITLQGFEGGSEERGENLHGVMPAHRFMSDEDVAAVLTYIRQSWNNDASLIEPDEVARIREETEDRRGTWTPEELRANVP